MNRNAATMRSTLSSRGDQLGGIGPFMKRPPFGCSIRCRSGGGAAARTGTNPHPACGPLWDTAALVGFGPHVPHPRSCRMNAVPRVMLVALGLAAIVSTASAQMDNLESSRIISVGLGGGVSVPATDAKDAFKNGFNGQGFVRVNLKFLPIRPRIDFSFQRFDLKDAQATGGPPTTPITGNGQGI